MALPTCECVKGLPIGEQLAAIYCATYTLAAGDVDGPYLLKSANLSDVDDATASRENIEAAGSPSGFASFIGQTAARDYTLPDSNGNIATTEMLVKAVNTDRASTTVLADDPELVISLPPGNYLIELALMFYSPDISAAPGAKCKVAFTGGTVSSAKGWFVLFNDPSMVSRQAPSMFESNVQDITLGSSGFDGNQNARAQFYCVVTATTLLSVQWSQNTSDLNRTRLGAGSYIRRDLIP